VPMRPVRGQMLALEAPGLIHHALFAPGGCLIPQADGTVMVGSTEEDAGFQSGNTAEGIQQLLRFATHLVPALGDKPLDSTWSGLRPAAADGLPILGAVPGWRNLHIASGHFRKGILLTPITADWMSNSILRGEIAPGMEAFSPGRLLDAVNI
nr:FAD-dependent oxidoreductase [Armatimonadota bacterium]